METIASILKFVTAIGAILSALYTIYRWFRPKQADESAIHGSLKGKSYSLRPEIRGKLRKPAIFLLFCGATNFGLGMFMFFQFSMMAIANITVSTGPVFPDQLPSANRETDWQFRHMMWVNEQHRQREATIFPIMAASWFCLAMVGTLTMAGASAMLRGGSYQLAFAGSLAGMLDLGCLLLNIPVSIWCLIILHDPEMVGEQLGEKPSPNTPQPLQDGANSTGHAHPSGQV